jgi:hypothetical protein
MDSKKPTTEELIDWLKSRSHRGEGWELVTTNTGSLALRQSRYAHHLTPEDALAYAMHDEALARVQKRHPHYVTTLG